jgi:hypothetical protein
LETKKLKITKLFIYKYVVIPVIKVRRRFEERISQEERILKRIN